MDVNIEIKLADRSNFTEFSMDSFDRFQEVRNVYRIENGKLVLKNNPFITDCRKDSIILQEEETSTYRWVTKDELISMKKDELVTERMNSRLLGNLRDRRSVLGTGSYDKSFTKLDELAISVDNDDSPFAEEIRASIEEAFQNAECVSTCERIRYNFVLAAIETAVM